MNSHVTTPKSFIKRFMDNKELWALNLNELKIEKITNKQAKLFTLKNYFSEEIEKFFQVEVETKIGKFIKDFNKYENEKKPSKHLQCLFLNLEEIIAIQVTRLPEFEEEVINNYIFGRPGLGRDYIYRQVSSKRSEIMRIFFKDLNMCILHNKSSEAFILSSNIIGDINLDHDEGMIFTVSPEIAVAFLPKHNKYVYSKDSNRKSLNINEILNSDLIHHLNLCVTYSIYNNKRKPTIIGRRFQLDKILLDLKNLINLNEKY